MTVYKIVGIKNNEIVSYHKNFPYKIGELYSTTIKRDGTGLYADTATQKYWENLYPEAISEFILQVVPQLVCYGSGFHAYKTLEGIKMSLFVYNWATVECTIPKGSEYYEGPVNLIVSNQIIIRSILFESRKSSAASLIL
jgi:hypothetical protein